MSYNDAVDLIKQTMQTTHAPDGVLGDFTGTAGDTRKLMINGGLAFLAAIAVMYIVLGILYESLIHPITILSTLPSAGIGAVLGLWIAGESFSIIAMIGIILLTGIVKKNAILVIDFAIHAERIEKLSPKDAIFKASITRFRPILMTSSPPRWARFRSSSATDMARKCADRWVFRSLAAWSSASFSRCTPRRSSICGWMPSA